VVGLFTPSVTPLLKKDAAMSFSMPDLSAVTKMVGDMVTPEMIAEMTVPTIVEKWPVTKAVFEQFGIKTDYPATSQETVGATALIKSITGM
jgi:hypothetical protein